MRKDPRDMAADARDQLAAFEAAVLKVKLMPVKAMVKQGKLEHQLMGEMFDRSMYADVAGNWTGLGLISPGWIARKLALGKSAQRGHFTEGLVRTIKSKRAFIADVTIGGGFDIDLMQPNIVVTVPRLTPGPKHRVAVKEYLPYYEVEKAPGLGSLANSQYKRIDEAVNEAEKAAFAKLKRISVAAGKGGPQRVIDVKMILRRLAV